VRRLITIDLRNAALDAFETYEGLVLPLVAQHGGHLECVCALLTVQAKPT
jgi:hypothetical protein